MAGLDKNPGAKLIPRQDSDADAEQRGCSPPASPLTGQHWPRSYERSMGIYSRSSSFVRSQSFLGNSKEDLNRQSSQISAHDLEGAATEAEVPLISGVYDLQNGRDKASEASGHQLISLGNSHFTRESQQGRSSFLQAVFNGVNVLAGVGILSMPYAIQQGGWVGLSCLFLFAAVCCYTAVLLRRCLDIHPSISSYPDVGEAAFGKLGRILVSGLLYSELFAVAVEFLILEGDNLAQLITFRGLNLGFVELSSEESFVIISAAVMLVTVWLRDLSVLSYLSAAGVLACLVVLLAVVCTGISGIGFTNPGQALNLQGFPIAVGLYAFCYCGHAVLIVCFVICTFLYGATAVVGFLMYGDDIKSEVTYNLPRGKLATNAALIATLVNPFAKYALTITPLAAALEEFLPTGLKTLNFLAWGMIIRTLLVVSTVIIAITVPFFTYLMALVGSFLSISVAIIIPSLCYMKLFSGSIPLWEFVLNVAMLGIGITACVAGTFSSILEIANGLSRTLL